MAPAARRRLPDWVLVLAAALLAVPVALWILAADPAPSLEVQGSAVPGTTIRLVGHNFPPAIRVGFLWDSAQISWLETVRTDQQGGFEATVRLPDSLSPGRRRLDGVRAADGAVLASTTVEVVAGSPASSRHETPAVPVGSAAASTPPIAASATPSQLNTSPGPIVGYGAETRGGSGGAVLLVHNLNDSGSGSLRAALNATGARTIVFNVAGTITLSSDILIREPFVTVAGETAPGPVAVAGGVIKVMTHEVVMRHLRLRPGDGTENPGDADGLTINGLTKPVYNVVLDHLTMVWGPDIGGLAILGNVHDVTVQNSIIGEGLYLSRHPEATVENGGHSMAMNVSQLDVSSPWPMRLTFWRNLFTTSDVRMPRFQGAECVDVVNNVIYNWGHDSAHGNPRSLNLVNNWYRAGPETVHDTIWRSQPSDVVPDLFTDAVYVAGNRADGFTATVDAPDRALAADIRCGQLSVASGSAETTYLPVLAGAGATLPKRDAVDERIVANVVRRAGTFFNGPGHAPPNPY
jgi:pectate lyase